MIALVLRYRTRMWLRSLRNRGRLRLGPGASVLLYAVIALVIGWFAANLTAAQRTLALEFGDGDVSGLLLLPIAAIVFMTVLSGVGIAVNELFVSTDMELLLTTPLSDLSLFLLKLLDCGVPVLPTMGWGLSAIAAYGFALGLGWGFYITAALAVLLLTLQIVLLDMAAVLLLSRVLPPRRLRDALLLLSSLVGVTAWLVWNAAARGHGPGSGSALTGGLNDLDARLRWTPIGWVYLALIHAQNGEVALALGALALLVLLAGLLGSGGLVVFARSYLTGWSAAHEASGRRRRTLPRRLPSASYVAGTSSVTLAVAIKDWRTLRRDVPYLSTLLPTLIYAVVYPFLLLRIPTGSTMAGRWLGLAGLPLVPLLAAASLALTAVGREGPGFDVLRSSPVAPLRLLAGKTLAVAVPVAALTALTGLGLAAYHNAPVPAFVVAVLGGAWLALGCSAIGVGTGAAWPDFEAKPGRRGQRLNSPGCLLYALLAALFGIGSAFLAAVAVARVLSHGGPLTRVAVALVALMVFAAGLASAFFMLVLGARSLARLLGPQE